MVEVGVIEVDDKRDPALLKEALGKLMPSLGPKRLYYKGNWDSLFSAKGGSAAGGENCLSVVGSRRLTHYGATATQQLAGQVAAAGVTIVSGFMYGGDKAAHQAALSCGGRTIAVMPCGINLVHPAGQEKLYQDIIDKGGLIISEYEGAAQPQTFTYVQRDRLVAGLSKAVLVTEASLKSGSLITASYAKKFGRKIFALPGQITSDVAKGTIALIRQGAEAVLEAQDILTFFNVVHASSDKVFSGEFGASRSQGAQKYSVAAGSDLERKIFDQLKNESMKADDMARLFAVPVAQVGTALSLMEMRGVVSQNAGIYYLA